MIIDELNNISERARIMNSRQSGDYIDPADGLLHCGKCRTPKQCKITSLGAERVFSCLCECKKKEQDAEKQRKKAEGMNEIRKACFNSTSLISATFDNDDGDNKMLMQVCHKYAEKFSLSSDWLLLYGNCGTGKSFAAACICNELLSRGFSARFVTVSEIEKELFSAENKTYIFAELNKVDILCIDDFGAERDTEYMQQIVYDLIDGRLKSGKPCVITTNLMPKDFSAPKNFTVRRIYSRLLERAVAFEVQGNDRRLKMFQENNKARLKTLLSE